MVGDPRVRPGSVLVGDDGDPARQVGEPGGPAERRPLPHDAALLVVAVLRLDHTVGIDDGGDQPGLGELGPPVRPGPGRAGDTGQPALAVIRVRDGTAVGGGQADQPRIPADLTPHQIQGAAAAVDQAGQPTRLVPHQLDPVVVGDRSGAEPEQGAVGGERPPRTVQTGDPQPIRVRVGGESGGVADRPVPTLTQPGEHQHPAVGEPEPRHPVGVEHQPGLHERGPARPERARTALFDAGVEGVVAAGPAQQPGRTGEDEVGFVLQEVAGRGVHRIVRVPGRGRMPVGLRRVDRQIHPCRVDPGHLQRGGDRGVRQC